MATVTSEQEVTIGHGVGPEPEFPPHRMTVDRYQRLVESGVYGDKSPVFLWEGRLVEKMTEGNRHAFSASSVVECLYRIAPRGWAIRPDKPILLADDSMPEPDVTVVRGALRDYGGRTPKASDIGLVVEVSDSSLRLDSRPVLRAYAANAIPNYWIVNIPSRKVEVFADPTGPVDQPAYRVHREYGPDDEVPVILDGLEVGRIAVRDILL